MKPCLGKEEEPVVLRGPERGEGGAAAGRALDPGQMSSEAECSCYRSNPPAHFPQTAPIVFVHYL